MKLLLGAIWMNPETGETEVKLIERFYQDFSNRDQRDILLSVADEAHAAALDAMDAHDEETEDRLNAAISAAAAGAVANELAV